MPVSDVDLPTRVISREGLLTVSFVSPILISKDLCTR